MKIKITGKDVKILEEASMVLVKLRSLGKSLDNPNYVDSANVARNMINSLLGYLENDARKAGLSGDLIYLLDSHPIKFNA